jgi:hypothetical protein
VECALLALGRFDSLAVCPEEVKHFEPKCYG